MIPGELNGLASKSKHPHGIAKYFFNMSAEISLQICGIQRAYRLISLYLGHHEVEMYTV